MCTASSCRDQTCNCDGDEVFELGGFGSILDRSSGPNWVNLGVRIGSTWGSKLGQILGDNWVDHGFGFGSILGPNLGRLGGASGRGLGAGLGGPKLSKTIGF